MVLPRGGAAHKAGGWPTLLAGSPRESCTMP